MNILSEALSTLRSKANDLHRGCGPGWKPGAYFVIHVCTSLCRTATVLRDCWL